MPRIEESVDIEVAIEEPKMYRVLLHNDDYTSMDFVVDVLIGIFRKSRQEAEQITWYIHQQGQAVCGIYTFEIAQMKVDQVRLYAKKEGFPLLATMEEDN